MCYIIAKRFNESGCVAMKTEHGKALVEFKRRMNRICDEEIQLVTISRPSAYGEYEPYKFVDSEEAFEEQMMVL